MLMIGVKQIIKQGSKLNIGDALVYIIKNTPEATTGLKERIKTVIEAFRQNQRAMYTYGMVNPDAMKVYDALDKMVYDLGKKAKELWNGDWDKLNNTMIAFEERLNKLSSTERQLLEANLRESPDFFKYLSQSENPIKIIDLWSTKIKTPYGNAIQDFSEDAIKIREEVLSGAKLYKIGTTGQSYIGESQFWSTVNPLDNLEEYAKINGIPIENLINNNFITIAKIKENVPVITRKAPPAPDNPPGWGGGVEVVVDPNSVVIESFHLVSDLKKFNK
jgi:Fe-S cluster biosynthesis and repair protein YggX